MNVFFCVPTPVSVRLFHCFGNEVFYCTIPVDVISNPPKPINKD